MRPIKQSDTKEAVAESRDVSHIHLGTPLYYFMYNIFAINTRPSEASKLPDPAHFWHRYHLSNLQLLKNLVGYLTHPEFNRLLYIKCDTYKHTVMHMKSSQTDEIFEIPIHDPIDSRPVPQHFLPFAQSPIQRNLALTAFCPPANISRAKVLMLLAIIAAGLEFFPDATSADEKANCAQDLLYAALFDAQALGRGYLTIALLAVLKPDAIATKVSDKLASRMKGDNTHAGFMALKDYYEQLPGNKKTAEQTKVFAYEAGDVDATTHEFENFSECLDWALKERLKFRG